MTADPPPRVLVQMDPATDDGSRMEPRRAAEVAFLGVVPGGTVVDLMCGVGNYADLLPEARYLGVDHDPAMLLVARGRSGGAERGLRAHVLGDVRSAPVRSASADHVLLAYEGLNAFRSPAARRAVLSEVARCLRPGGTALVDLWRPFENPVPDADRSHVGPHELARLTAGAGLEVTDRARLHLGVADSDKAETASSGQFLLRRRSSA
ncbi:class I SAM-dependent methyltransferase [Streptomyces microflavus]|uniref:class I SAM-dependent methyltransferase n=1 Tax=Streptomyces microflavus TaxID=1919 RepID=UPI00380A8508